MKLAFASGGTVAGIALIIALLLLAFGKCNFLFHPVASVRSTPTPTSSGVVEQTPTPSAKASSTPTATPTATPTSTPKAAPPKLIIASLPWGAGEVGFQYQPVKLGASGGTPPYKWSISSGSLPGGLSLSTDGTVSGTPTATGGPFTVRVDDAANQAAGVNTAIPLVPYLTAKDVCGPTGCLVEAACISVCGTYTAPIGGVGPFSYQLTSSPGNLPPGTTFIGGPSLGGTFTQAGGFSFSVDITDSLGAKASISPLFNVFPHLILSNNTLGGGPFPGPADVSMPLTSSDPNITKVTINEGPGYTVIPGSVVYTAATLSFKIAGTWATTVPPVFQATVYDSYPCGPGVNCSSTADVQLSMG